MKKKMVLMLCLSGTMLLAACSSGTASATAAASTAASTASSTSASEKLMGGWQVNADKLAVDDNTDVKEAFTAATKELVGVNYEPVTYLGSQVVAGVNYCLLCRATPVGQNSGVYYVLMYIYVDTTGTAQVTKVAAIGESAGSTDSSEPIITGSWAWNQGATDLDSNTDVKTAFDKAAASLMGSTYECAAYLGSQVVSGTNYSLLCRSTPVSPDAEPGFVLTTLYADAQGNAEFQDVIELDLGSYAGN